MTDTVATGAIHDTPDVSPSATGSLRTMLGVKSAVRKVLVAGDRIHSGPGRGLRVEGTDSVRVHLGLYEAELNGWIRRLATPGTAVFDIGAQIGFDALMFARLTRGAPVLTVEGDPALAPTIRRNVNRNGLRDRVAVHTGWVGDGSAGTVTLDGLARDYFQPGFVKLDIEGSEGATLAGAPELLDSCDRWLVETHGLDQDNICLAALAAAGFRVDTVSPRRWLPDHRPLDHNRWLVATRG